MDYVVRHTVQVFRCWANAVDASSGLCVNEADLSQREKLAASVRLCKCTSVSSILYFQTIQPPLDSWVQHAVKANILYHNNIPALQAGLLFPLNQMPRDMFFLWWNCTKHLVAKSLKTAVCYCYMSTCCPPLFPPRWLVHNYLTNACFHSHTHTHCCCRLFFFCFFFLPTLSWDTNERDKTFTCSCEFRLHSDNLS